MIEYVYLPVRVIREQFYEEWFYYKADSEHCIRVDKIIIFFNQSKNNVFLFTNCEDDFKNEDYYSGVTNLVHDMQGNDNEMIDFDIEIILIPNNLDEEQKDRFISEKVKDLREKYNCISGN